MRAAVLHAIGEPLRVEEVPTPRPGPGQVLVKVAAAGVCHSDLHQQDGSVPPHRIPLIMGHENAGWVAALGQGAEGLAEGDPVVVYGGWGCGHCRFCLGGHEQLCDGARWGGLGPDGGYADYLLVPATRHLLRAGHLDPGQGGGPDGCGPEFVPGGEEGPAVPARGHHGHGHRGWRAGPVRRPVPQADDERHRDRGGDLTGQAAARGEPGRRSRHRRVRRGSLEEIRELSGGEGAAAVLDFVGIDATMRLGLAALARQGLFVLVGLAGGSVPMGFFSQAPEVAFTTSVWGSRNDLAEVIALAQQGKLTAATETHRLDDINQVLERLELGLVEGRAVVVP